MRSSQLDNVRVLITGTVGIVVIAGVAGLAHQPH